MIKIILIFFSFFFRKKSMKPTGNMTKSRTAVNRTSLRKILSPIDIMIKINKAAKRVKKACPIGKTMSLSLLKA